MNKIFLIDGHSQIFRMYYAFMRRPMVNSKGVDTSILFGFTKMLIELISRENPTHIAVSFDLHAKTFRHIAYPEYKANRGETPELVIEAMEPLKEILGAMNIPVVAMEGYEADDVIGSMATQWGKGENIVYMVTPDKDYGQLVSENIFQYKPSKGNEFEILGRDEVCSHYGISNPQQVIDILTIWGDASDNVPGVKGIGEVGAKKLIAKYGSVEAVVTNAKELSAKQQEAIAQAKEQIPLSKFLVTIKRDIELPVTLEDISLHPINATAVDTLFDKYEFNSLKKMLLKERAGQIEQGIEQQKGAADEEKRGAATIVSSLKESTLEQVAKMARKEGALSIKMMEKRGLIIAAGNCYHIIPSLEKTAQSESGKYNLLKELLEDYTIEKSGLGFKNIIKRVRKYGIILNDFLEKGYLTAVNDIELMHYLLNPERSHSEEVIINQYLNINLQELDETEKEEAPDLFSFQNEDETEQTNTPKMGEIAACSLYNPVCRLISAELKAMEQESLYREIEMPLIGVLSDMEWEGVTIDTAQLHNYSIALTKEMGELETEIRDMAGDEKLNVSSPKQIGQLLFEKLKISDKVKKSARGNYPTDEETLNEVADKHPIVNKILEFRALKKLISTYIDALPELIDKKSGKIHTTFNQALTATGRLSSANPNLQNIPIRSARGKEIRKAFIPSTESGAIVSADYSQIELRLMAHMSGDAELIEAFLHNKDIHTATATKIFKVQESEVTKEQRSKAKSANFGIIYGISAFGLAQRMGITRGESKALIEEYFKSYPGVKEYINNMIASAKEKGYVETIYGRRRYLLDINSRNANVRGFNERNAINAPLQGSAADIIKVAMVELFKRLKSENITSKIVLQVHDELILDVIESEIEKVTAIVTDVMENIAKLKVPLLTDCRYGKNWLEAH